MFDHIGFNVDDVARSKAFYVAALAPLGMAVLAEGEGWAIIGSSAGRIWIGQLGLAASPIHFAFRADSRAAVDAFHKSAIQAGGRDNGAPGLRPEYGPGYYAAFVYDPDGHNVEAVTGSAT
ncbi:catechol 2,3-dioxygenase-like lactoylglutathione lyase family enzyme [Roseiarcus fermentans]|uniref:Catechol 2,3-dioxygenase-like lactoylglutathione lyase family enzyme n=1 Tax=Roseiarcus fermentans TaxID=1473586 RepID=A0A366FIC3_9HYPH|nr:VOC family protein [Roseiarcus fermentans]RBP14337.1 catechol 2,3-dioxygenase-like lactoylglutathione lyase family enzyme [Roseiarcus fermentans]